VNLSKGYEFWSPPWRHQEAQKDGHPAADGDDTRRERAVACLQQHVQRAERAQHQGDALNDAEQARRLPEDQLDAEGGCQSHHLDPDIEGGCEEIEPGHAALSKAQTERRGHLAHDMQENPCNCQQE
jgi:hypothetical protein